MLKTAESARRGEGPAVGARRGPHGSAPAQPRPTAGRPRPLVRQAVVGRTPQATDLGHAYQADPLVCLRRTSRATVVAFVTDGPALRDVLDHLGLLQPGDPLAPSLSVRNGPGPWMRWGES